MITYGDCTLSTRCTPSEKHSEVSGNPADWSCYVDEGAYLAFKIEVRLV